MPQITVDHSASLTPGFDRSAFALALHEEVVRTAAAKPEACKTQFRATEVASYAYEAGGHALVHVVIGLLAGRSEETKAQLSENVLELVRRFVGDGGGLGVHAAVEVRELDASYRKFDA
ncbi:hypothetical protein OK074_4819 [Actinobacteria bacterium OK074]|nr:hypothetical protein OK074_4819 [Actinobacteria bacterium OK074]